MCEFCAEHGEGKKWYLQMKNYSEELLYIELTKSQKEIVKANNRLEWNTRFFGSFVMPAITGISESESEKSSLADEGRPSEEEIVKARKTRHFGQVIPIEDVEKVLDIVDSITRLPCGCRFISIGKTDKRYCFGLGMDKWGILGKFPDATSSLEVLEKEEAQKIIREYDKEGLLHSIWTGVTPYIIGICNCDRDCCVMLRGIRQFNNPNVVASSNFLPQYEIENCVFCKKCTELCPMYTIELIDEDSENKRIEINTDRCIGCGVCAFNCKSEAITMVKKFDKIPVETMRDLMIQNIKGRSS